ncbi:MAG: putative methyltransferase [Bacteroidetes bacterium]|nr:putative methyltransferase [Bacteroidota bacterium]
MGPMTETIDIAPFYDWLSRDYDAMTSFDQRFVRERPFIKLLVDNYGITTALDAGTGTGFHALLLAQLGVQVTAVDISPEMIEALHRRAAEMGLHVTTHVAPFHLLPELVPVSQDAIFALGNTLAHSASRADLLRTLTAFQSILRPGGVVFVQVLNYRQILSTRERVQMVRQVGSTQFTRWYEYLGDLVRFHITQTNTDSGEEISERSIILRPVTDEQLREVMVEAGFEEVRVYGGISMAPYDPAMSKDCVVLARKPLPSS